MNWSEFNHPDSPFFRYLQEELEQPGNFLYPTDMEKLPEGHPKHPTIKFYLANTKECSPDNPVNLMYAVLIDPVALPELEELEGYLNEVPMIPGRGGSSCAWIMCACDPKKMGGKMVWFWIARKDRYECFDCNDDPCMKMLMSIGVKWTEIINRCLRRAFACFCAWRTIRSSSPQREACMTMVLPSKTTATHVP